MKHRIWTAVLAAAGLVMAAGSEARAQTYVVPLPAPIGGAYVGNALAQYTGVIGSGYRGNSLGRITGVIGGLYRPNLGSYGYVASRYRPDLGSYGYVGGIYRSNALGRVTGVIGGLYRPNLGRYGYVGGVYRRNALGRVTGALGGVYGRGGIYGLADGYPWGSAVIVTPMGLRAAPYGYGR